LQYWTSTIVQAVSVARECIDSPRIFRQAREFMAGQPVLPPALEEQRSALLAHFELARVIHGERITGQRRRKCEQRSDPSESEQRHSQPIRSLRRGKKNPA